MVAMCPSGAGTAIDAHEYVIKQDGISPSSQKSVPKRRYKRGKSIAEFGSLRTTSVRKTASMVSTGGECIVR